MSWISLLAGLAFAVQASGEPGEGTLWSWGLADDLVPATGSPPATARPVAPVETWYWQFFAEEADGYDALASRVVLDCDARLYRMTLHLAYRDGRPTGARETDATPARPIAPGTVMDGLRQHLCEPDASREVRRYSSVISARQVFDDYFARR